MKNAFIQELYDLDLYHPTRYRLKKNEILTFKQGIAAMWASCQLITLFYENFF